MKDKDIYREDLGKIADYLAHEASAKERIELKKWLQEDADNQAFFDKVKKVWQASEIKSEEFCPDVAYAWEKIKPLDIGKTAPLPGDKPTKSFTTSTKHWPLYLAASLALLLGLGIVLIQDPAAHFIQKLTLEKTQAREGKTAEVLLSDDSKVWLNSGSSLYYPQTFVQNRTVYLEGEAYFEIEPDVEKPFTIYTGQSVTEVLGTSFNVSESGESVVVTVTHGRVALYPKKNEDKKVILEKGEKGWYSSAEKEVSKSRNNNANFLSWRTGVLTFNDTPLASVAEALSRHYQVPVVVDSSTSVHCRLTSRFEDKQLEDVLELIKLTLNVEINKEEGRILIKGNGC